MVALVSGTRWTDVPKDLYIPPDALEVWLDSFSGPLDVLLYLIKRQNIDILNIPMSSITEQYMDYIHLMESHRLGLAAEYLVMAAILLEIKSKLLLPVTVDSSDPMDVDPRLELVQRLQMYEQYKEAARDVDALYRQERDCYVVTLGALETTRLRQHPPIELSFLMNAWFDVLRRQLQQTPHTVSLEKLSVQDKMMVILLYASGEWRGWVDVINIHEGRRGVVVTLLALLELAKQSKIVLMQNEPFDDLYLKAM